MSGVVKGIGKVFKATVIAPAKYANKTTHQVVNFIKKQPILEAIIIAVAAYFTMGAALAYFGAAGAAAGGAAGAAAGGAAGAAAGGAVGGTAFFSGAAVTAGVEAGGASAALAGAAGASVAVGTAAGVTADVALSTVADTAASAVAEGGAVTATNLAAVSVTADVAADSTVAVGAGLSTDAAISAGAGIAAGAGSMAAGGGDDIAVGGQSVDSSTGQIDSTTGNTFAGADGTPVTANQPSFFDRVTSGVKGLFSSGTPATGVAGAPAAAAPASSSLLGDTGKMMLLQGGMQIASSLLNKPQPQMSYAGVNEKGDGPGIGIQTTNNGFGLATGGAPEQAPTGVPAALRPGGISPNSGAALSNAAIKNQAPVSAGNIGQTVANSTGVGGLVPQGAVNYMGNPG